MRMVSVLNALAWFSLVFAYTVGWTVHLLWWVGAAMLTMLDMLTD